MAVKSELRDDGFSLWDEWSRTASNYQEKVAENTWQSFRGTGIGIGSLIHLAKEHGWHKGHRSAAPTPDIRMAPKANKGTGKYAKELFLGAKRDDGYVAAHGYAQRKGITSAGGAGRGNASGKLIGQNADCIIVPIRNILTDKVQGVECINAVGDKQSFGTKSGGALVLGNSLQKTAPWYVLEGWASAYSTVFHHDHHTAVCAFGKGRQDDVANELAHCYAPSEIMILREAD